MSRDTRPRSARITEHLRANDFHRLNRLSFPLPTEPKVQTYYHSNSEDLETAAVIKPARNPDRTHGLSLARRITPFFHKTYAAFPDDEDTPTKTKNDALGILRYGGGNLDIIQEATKTEPIDHPLSRFPRQAAKLYREMDDALSDTGIELTPTSFRPGTFNVEVNDVDHSETMFLYGQVSKETMRAGIEIRGTAPMDAERFRLWIKQFPDDTVIKTLRKPRHTWQPPTTDETRPLPSATPDDLEDLWTSYQQMQGRDNMYRPRIRITRPINESIADTFHNLQISMIEGPEAVKQEITSSLTDGS